MKHMAHADFFKSVHKIAIIGAKDKPDSPVDRVGRYLIKAGFTIFPVHPVRSDVWGLKTYTHLGAIPEQLDLVNIFRASEHCLNHALEVLKLPYKCPVFWMQTGIRNPEAIKRLQSAGIIAIEDRCIMIEHSAYSKQGTFPTMEKTTAE